MSECVVYWIYDKNCKEIELDGYVGITVNSKRRFIEHNNKFSNVVCMEVIYEGSLSECIEKEIQLRPEPLIGWNVAAGGSIPPRPKTIKQCEICSKSVHIANYVRWHGPNCDPNRKDWRPTGAGKGAKGVPKGPMSEETKAKVSANRKGKYVGPRPAWIGERISAAKKGKSIKSTGPRSEETKRKISLSQLGIKRGPRPRHEIEKIQATKRRLRRNRYETLAIRFDAQINILRMEGFL